MTTAVRRRPPFTSEQILTIREMREAGAAWRAIGAATGRSHFGCRRYWIEKLGGIGGWTRPRGRSRPSAPAPVRRSPLPPGSLSSWGAITSGTAIDGLTFRTDGRTIG